MKKTLSIIWMFILSSVYGQSNNDKTNKPNNDDKGARNYSFSEFHSFNFYHKARVNYFPENGVKDGYKGGGFNIGRWDWIDPMMGMNCYVEGTGLISQFLSPVPTAGLLEAGYSWMFNNKKVRDSGKAIGLQWGMGVGFGIRSIIVNKTTFDLYGMLWPEVTSIITIKDHITIIPKYIVTPMLNNGFLGLRTSSEFLFVYRIAGFLGANVRLSSEVSRFNDGITTSTGKNFTGKAKALSVQFGISFHQFTRDKKKSRN